MTAADQQGVRVLNKRDYTDARRAVSPGSPRRPGPERALAAARVGDLIAGVVREAGLHRSPKLERLSEAWRDAVGREQAAQTRLVAFKRGVLTVEVGSAALAQELGVYYRQALVEGLRERSGLPVRDLRCKVTGVVLSPSPDERK